MAVVPIQIIRTPHNSGIMAFGPETMRMASLPSVTAEKLSRYVGAGHQEKPPLTEAEEAEMSQWAEIENALESNPLSLPHNQDETISQLVLSNTYTCNMGCTYCYNEMDSKPVKGSQTTEGMSLQTAQSSLDMTIAQARKGTRLKLFFVGGEPLLERQLMESAVSYAKERCADAQIGLDIIVYTNGTLITRRTLEWFSSNQISVVVSLDGPENLNTNRTYLSGRPTTHIVLRNIRRLLESGSQKVARVRAVSMPTTPLVALHKYLLALGFNEIHVQPMYNQEGISSAAMESQIQLLQWWTELMKRGTVIDIMPFSAYFRKLLTRGRTIGSWMPCNAGRNAMTVGPDGRIYSCHHAIEEDDFQMGHVNTGVPSTKERRDYFHSVESRSACSQCWAKHICGGECYHRAAAAGAGQDGTVPAVCIERKGLIGMALDSFAKIARSNPSSLAALAAGRYQQVPIDPDAYTAKTLEDYM